MNLWYSSGSNSTALRPILRQLFVPLLFFDKWRLATLPHGLDSNVTQLLANLLTKPSVFYYLPIVIIYCFNKIIIIIIYMYIRAVSSYSLWYLVSEVKVNLFHIWICWNIQIFIHKGVSFSRKILLKLIHYKSLNSEVTWSRFKYFPLLATFAAKLIHFCTSYCSFSLHLRHIELQSFRWEKIRAFIRSILDFWSRVSLTLFR